MLSPENRRRIRHIELQTRKLVDSAFSGAYRSTFKGRGLAFAGVRPYEPGDSVRDMDWKVTARAGQAYIRQYVEERELTVLLVLDSSASCLFGTTSQQKSELAARLGAVLSYAAVTNNDRVGLVVFSDHIEHLVPPRKGRNHVLRLIRDLLSTHPSSKGTDIALALKVVQRLLKGRAVVFVISDFLVTDEDYYRDLFVLSREHDVIAIMLSDPLEQAFPQVGLMGLHDAETGAVQWVDTANTNWQREFRQRSIHYGSLRDAALLRAGVDRISIPPDGDYVRALVQFFRERAQRRQR